MKKFYKFENKPRDVNSKIVEFINNNSANSTNIYSFINNPNQFYLNLGGILKFLVREKRHIVFETPNRAKITHEYDFEKCYIPKFHKCQFIYLPLDKLDWLQIFLNGKRLVIASQSTIKSIIYALLKDELTILINRENLRSTPKKLFEDLWIETKANPCFIHLPEVPPESFLIELTYYSSVVIDKEGTNHKKGDIWGLVKNYLHNIDIIEERYISYTYITNSPYNPWVYIKSPDKYEIEVASYNSEAFVPYEVGKNDANIVSRYFVRNNKHCKEYNDSNNRIKFNIAIKVPKSLKYWYWTLIIIGVILTMFLIFEIGFYAFGHPIKNAVSVPLSMAIIAAFIATRGWMIQDETLLSRYSKFATIIMGLLVLLSATVNFLGR